MVSWVARVAAESSRRVALVAAAAVAALVAAVAAKAAPRVVEAESWVARVRRRAHECDAPLGVAASLVAAATVLADLVGVARASVGVATVTVAEVAAVATVEVGDRVRAAEATEAALSCS